MPLDIVSRHDNDSTEALRWGLTDHVDRR